MLVGPILDLTTSSITGETQGSRGGALKVTFNIPGEYIFAVAATDYTGSSGAVAIPYVSDQSNDIEVVGDYVKVMSAGAFAVYRISDSIQNSDMLGAHGVWYVYATVGLSTSFPPDYSVEYLP